MHNPLCKAMTSATLSQQRAGHHSVFRDLQNGVSGRRAVASGCGPGNPISAAWGPILSVRRDRVDREESRRGSNELPLHGRMPDSTLAGQPNDGVSYVLEKAPTPL